MILHIIQICCSSTKYSVKKTAVLVLVINLPVDVNAPGRGPNSKMMGCTLCCVALLAAPAAAPQLQLLSKRAQALGGTTFSFEVGGGGGAMVTIAGSKPSATFSLTSSFSEPGAVQGVESASRAFGHWMTIVSFSGPWGAMGDASGE